MNATSLAIDHRHIAAYGSQSLSKSKQVVKKAKASKKPLNAYNLYFKIERERMLNGTDTLGLPVTVKDLIRIREEHKSRPKRRHRKTHGKIAFKELNQIISKRWKQVPESERRIFHEHAMIEKEDHARKMSTETQQQQQQHQQQQQQQQQNQEHSVESETSNVLPEPSNVVSVGFGDLGLDQWDNITSNNNNNNNNSNEEFEDLAPIPYFPEMMNKPLDACSGRTLPSHPIEPLLHSLDPMPRSVVSADNDDEQYNWREAISNIESNSVVKNDRSNDSWNLPVISFDGRGSEKNQILFQPMDPTEMDSIFE